MIRELLLPELGWCASYQFVASYLQIHPYCLLYVKSSGPFKYFTLPAGTVLSFVSRGHERDISAGRSCVSWSQCAGAFTWQAPAA